MDEITITETETTMANGSISVHCEATAENGHKVAASYNVPMPFDVDNYHKIRARTLDAIREQVRDLNDRPALEVVPSDQPPAETGGNHAG